MFTGIVEIIGTVTNVASVPGGRQLVVDAGSVATGCVLGASICVNGVCLTVTKVTKRELAFDIITETMERTTLGSIRLGDPVNLEPSLPTGGRIDGHFVQGHVDGLATVSRVQMSAREHVAWLKPDAPLLSYIVPKGSVCLDGVSLTIAEADANMFSVALIPTTLERTTLNGWRAGTSVNVETDIIVRAVVHRLAAMTEGGQVTLETLREADLA